MTLSATVDLRVEATASTALDFGVAATATPQLFQRLALTSGTGAGQADKVYAKTLTLSAGANADLDLSGALTDVLGAAFVLVKLKVFAVHAHAANANAMTITRPAQGFAWVSAAGTTSLAPGEFKLLVCRSDVTAIPIANGATDVVNFLAGAGSDHLYDVCFIGTSA